MIYIATQITLVSSHISAGTINNEWNTIVRRIEANSKEEAVGKFILGTNHIKAKEKLDLLIYELDNLIAL